jgi:hypothetical protein
VKKKKEFLFPMQEIGAMTLLFSITYMCAQYFHYIHSPTPFPHILLHLSHWYQPPPLPHRACSVLLFAEFVKEKK